MPSYTLYQIPIHELHDQINAKGWDKAKQDHPEVATHLAVTLNGSDSFEASMFPHYRPAAMVDAENLEHAFAILNGYQPGNIVALHKHARSASVGDIFRDGAKHHMVDSFGFQEIRLTGATA